jgi:cell division septal protein FtsQ
MRKYKKSFKTKKKILNLKRILLAFLFLSVFSGAVYLLFFSTVFQVKKINVFGADKIPEKEIENIISKRINKTWPVLQIILARHILG